MGPSSEDQSKVKQHKIELIWIYVLCAFYLFNVVNYLSIMDGFKYTKYNCEIFQKVHIHVYARKFIFSFLYKSQIMVQGDRNM